MLNYFLHELDQRSFLLKLVPGCDSKLSVVSFVEGRVEGSGWVFIVVLIN